MTIQDPYGACIHCGGVGYIGPSAATCPRCDGTGYEPTSLQAELREAEANYQQAHRQFEAARAAREQAIRHAACTLSVRQVAQHVSLTAQRVQQIAPKR